VTITDNDGCVTTASYQINTLGGITSSFSYNIMSGGVQFNDLTSNASSWLWQFGDGQVSPNQNPMHSYQTSGSYQACLIVTDMFGCMDTSCQEVMVSVGLGGEVWKKLEVFPNPVQDLLQLRAEGLAGPEVAIRVRDLMGREILSQTASLQAQITLRATSLPTGTYVLEVQDEKGNRYQGRFLKK
jgi:PKD repeat protein